MAENELAISSWETAAKRFVLDKIASGEAPDYNVLFGGGTFKDFSRHPGIRTPIPGKNDYSTAAGRYQFIEDTWKGQAEKLGLKDFSPGSQDIAAWDLADTTYRSVTGRDLMSDAKSRNVDWSALGSQWVSLAGHAPQTANDPYEIDVPDDAPGATPAPNLDLVQRILSTKYDFTPVDYDPFAVEQAIKGDS